MYLCNIAIIITFQKEDLTCNTQVDVRRLVRRYSVRDIESTQQKAFEKAQSQSYGSTEKRFVNDGFETEVKDEEVMENLKPRVNSTKTAGKVFANKLEVQAKKSFRICYERMIWFLFLLSTALLIIDRFTGSGDNILNRKSK